MTVQTDRGVKPPPEKPEAEASLLGAMLIVMWVQRPVGCTLAPEARRRLVLTRETDREHLANDIASVERIARRYTASTGTGDQSGFLACKAALIEQLSTMHEVSPDRLRAGAQ